MAEINEPKSQILSNENEPKPKVFYGEADRRIVLVGKTGAGKSATGNTILRRKAFDCSISSGSVTTVCKKEIGEFDGQTLAVVDTPGLFDTFQSEEYIKTEVSRCMFYAAPGPHVFLIVIQVGRFTAEEQNTVRIIQEVFGELAAHYTMVLFTHGDDLKADGLSIEKFVDRNQALCDFVGQCRGYHVFDNRDKDVFQVKSLLEKINTLVQRNENRCFTQEMIRKIENVKTQIIYVILRENSDIENAEAIRLAEETYATRQAARGSAGATTCGDAIKDVLEGPTGAAAEAAVEDAVKAAKKQKCTIQ